MEPRFIHQFVAITTALKSDNDCNDFLSQAGDCLGVLENI